MHDLADSFQWPGMATNVLAAWLMASGRVRQRHWGFWVFIISCVCWTIYGIHIRSWAMVILQAALLVLNIRGLFKTDAPAT